MNQYASMTDEQLVDILKTNPQNNDAFVELLNRSEGMIRSLVVKFFRGSNGSDLEEQLHEGEIVLFKSIEDYDPDRNAKFSTYAYTCINNHFLDTVRWKKAACRIPENETVSLDDPVDDDGTTTKGDLIPNNGPSIEQQMIHREEVEIIFKTLRNHLSEAEFAVWSESVWGFSTAEIAAKHGMDAKAVSNALARARKKVSSLFPSL